MKLTLDIPDSFARLVFRAIRAGAERAAGPALRAGVAEFFDCLTPAELAAHLGVTERQVRALAKEHALPKDTRLGERLPRYSLSAVKAAMTAARVRARKAPKLRVMKKEAA